MRNVFITAATGHVGQRLIPLLAQNPEYKLVLPTRSKAKLATVFPDLPESRVVSIEGSVQDPQWLEQVFRTHSVESVVVNLTDVDELWTTLNLFSAVKRVPSVSHIIYISAAGDLSRMLVDMEGHLPLCGHGAVKVLCENGLRALGRTYTIIGPALFFGNDERAQAAVMGAGIWPEPVGNIGAARIAESDIAEAIAIAVADQGKKWGNRKIHLGTRRAYTDDDIAGLYTKFLGRDVKASASEVSYERLEEHARNRKGPAWGRDMALMFRGIAEYGFGLTEEEYASQVEFLGRQPISYETFVENLCKKWKEDLEAKKK